MPDGGGDRRPVQRPCCGRPEKAGRLCKSGLQPRRDLEHWDSIAIRHPKVSHAADLVPRGGHVRPRHIVLAHRRLDGLGAPNQRRARSPGRRLLPDPKACVGQDPAPSYGVEAHLTGKSIPLMRIIWPRADCALRGRCLGQRGEAAMASRFRSPSLGRFLPRLRAAPSGVAFFVPTAAGL